MNLLRNARTFASGQDNVVIFEHDIVIGYIGAGRQQDQPPASSFYFLLKIRKGAVAPEIDFIEVIESGAS